MIRTSWTTGTSVEATLELWAFSLREVKGRLRPLFTQDRIAASAGAFLDGLKGRTDEEVTIFGRADHPHPEIVSPGVV